MDKEKSKYLINIQEGVILYVPEKRVGDKHNTCFGIFKQSGGGFSYKYRFAEEFKLLLRRRGGLTLYPNGKIQYV